MLLESLRDETTSSIVMISTTLYCFANAQAPFVRNTRYLALRDRRTLKFSCLRHNANSFAFVCSKYLFSFLHFILVFVSAFQVCFQSAGGYDGFKANFPECCASLNTNGSYNSGSETASDEEFHSDNSTPGRCSPVSPLRGATPVLGLGSLKIASLRTKEEDYVFESDSDVLTSRLRVDCNYTKPRFQRSKSSYNSLPAPAEILPGLYLGCAKDAASEEVLSKYGITHILNVTPNLPNVFESDSRYCYKQIPIIDHWSQNLSQFFPEAIQFIGE